MQRSVMGAGLCAAFSVLALSGLEAQAQDYPTRPITMVVPLPAGGTGDLLCRFAGEKAGAALGQQVVIENRPGGASRLGMEQVLRAQPDGYTLLCSTQLSYSITHIMFAKSGLDPRPLEPVSVLATYPLVILVRKDFPADDMKGFVAYAKAGSGKVTYGHQGKGNTGHLLGELMMLKGGFKMTEVPYRGSAPAINDLLAGTIDMVPDYLLSNKGNIDTGKLKMIAVADTVRLREYPKVERLEETWPGVTSITWMAVSAPPKTPKAIVDKVSAAIAKGFREADMQTRIRKLEAEPRGTTPEEMRAMIKESHDIWAPVIQSAHIVIE